MALNLNGLRLSETLLPAIFSSTTARAKRALLVFTATQKIAGRRVLRYRCGRSGSATCSAVPPVPHQAGKWVSGNNQMETIMALSLGTVTRRDTGGFEGNFTMMTGATRISILPNEEKETEKHPDFRVYANGGGEIGAGWVRTAKGSGNLYVSLTFAHPAIGPSRVFANLTPAHDGEDENKLAILWSPKN